MPSAPPTSFSEKKEMAVKRLALQLYIKTNAPNIVPASVATAPLNINIVMTPQPHMPGHLPLCAPTSIVLMPVDHDTVMTPQTPMSGNLSHTFITNVPNAVPISLNAIPIPVISQPLVIHEEFTTSSNIHPLAPGWPLQIPESLDSIIQYTVMELLTLNSSEFVQATVSGVVNGCIPHLKELINTKIASLTSDHTIGSRTAEGSRNNGWEGDNEDELPLPKARKRPGPHSHMNRLHLAYRKYLTEKGVMVTQSSKGPAPILMQAPHDEVQEFIQNRSSPPTIKIVAINWTSSLKISSWNQEMIHLLALDFHAKIKIGTYPTIIYDANCMSVNVLRHICVQKLSQSHDTCQQQVEVDIQPIIEQRQEAILKLYTI
ncbi:hypothetical protein HD554DRAFT_2177765 [Boletus coccyginus]|nr:hypothetical protein HD554DRAFT_2177765 [Boletus coccyginus]